MPSVVDNRAKNVHLQGGGGSITRQYTLEHYRLIGEYAGSSFRSVLNKLRRTTIDPDPTQLKRYSYSFLLEENHFYIFVDIRT